MINFVAVAILVAYEYMASCVRLSGGENVVSGAVRAQVHSQDDCTQLRWEVSKGILYGILGAIVRVAATSKHIQK